MDTLSYCLGMVGIFAFAVTAVLAVAPKGIDLFSAMVLGIITAVGGGTLRDITLDVPVFWSNDLTYIWVAIGASIIAFVAESFFYRKAINSLMLYLDALGVALFAIQSTQKAWDLNFGLPLAPVLLGIITAIGGGLIRDTLAERKNLLMHREIYAVPVLLGCSLYVLLQQQFPEFHFFSAMLCTGLIFMLRAAAIHWDLSVPDWLMTHTRPR